MNIDVIFPDITSTLQITGCHFGLRPPGWSYPKHHHHLYELLYCYEGNAIQLVNGKSLPIHSSDWLFMKAGTRHQTDNDTDKHFAFFNIHFDIDDNEIRKLLSVSDYWYFPKAFTDQTQLPFYMNEIDKIMHVSLLETKKKTTPEQTAVSLSFELKIALQAYILLILKEIIVLQRAGVHEANEKKGSSIYETDIAHIIEEQLQRLVMTDCSIAQIAQELNLSRSQCTKIFTRVYGIPPHLYLSHLKLSKAKYLLVTSNRTIEKIADELGFHSASHFSRQFRNRTGVSPNQFRPKHIIIPHQAIKKPKVIEETM